MAEEFEQLLRRLSQDQALFQGVEEVTRQAAILPVLSQLGWNIFDVREVTPEHDVGSGRVDYCLHVLGREAVYLEVKRAAEDLERHEKQLLDYAFTRGVRLAVLTNGLLWWLYLPLSPGEWQQRKFFTIDIREQEPAVAARHFAEFLGRDAVSHGAAVAKAQAVRESREKDRLIDETMPRVWHELFSAPDETLIELFTSKVEGMCGYRPEPESVAAFIRAYVASSTSSSGETGGPRAEPVERRPAGGGRSKQHGASVRIGEKKIEARSVADLYLQILRYLCDNGYMPALRQHLPYATSGKRYLLATQPFHQGGNPIRVPVEYQGYFVEAHKDYDNAINHMAGLLKRIGLMLEDVSS